MKYSKLAFITALISIIFYSPNLLFAYSSEDKPVSIRERERNAARQMRDFRKGELQRTGTEKLNKLSGVTSRVKIEIGETFRTSSTLFFHDNMESGVNGWSPISYSGADLWHQTTADANSQSVSWWCGIEHQGNYNNNERVNAALISPIIQLTGAVGQINLLFAEKFITETGWDFCMVDVSSDGGSNWTQLRGGYGSAPCGDTEGWELTSLDLTPFSNQTIIIRFYFDTGDSLFNEFPGWVIDDVTIFDQSGLITGKKFFDVNNNSVKDTGERGIKEWLITATGNGISLTTRTNYRGRYWLPLPLGTYAVTETARENWDQTYPASGQWDISLSTPDTIADSVHFGNYTQASFINGIKYHDLNQNGYYDQGDSAIPEWKIILTDTLGNQIDFDRTDSLGQYQLYVFEPGKYFVQETEKRGWVKSEPDSEYYAVEIPDLQTNISGIDFGNYYSPATNGIMGQKFIDRNRNHVRDQGEEALAGLLVRLLRKGNGINYNNYRKTYTDSSGYYQFLSVEPDTYKVVEFPSEGWWQSYPESCYTIVLSQGGTFDTLDFGNYQIKRSSIQGLKYNDQDGSGERDGGEQGMSGWTIFLSGTSAYGTSVSESRETNPMGNYTFADLWPGNYTVSEVFRQNWRQTYPQNLKPHFVQLNPEENLENIDFGNTIDSAFSLAFRTFLPESLALAVDYKGKRKPVKAQPDKLEFSITIYNDTTEAAHSIIVHTTQSPDTSTVTFSPPGRIEYISSNLKKFQIIFDAYVQPGDSVTIHGFCKKLGLQHASFQKWLLAGGSTFKGNRENFVNTPRYPMPNAINLLSEGTGIGLKVGIGGPHSVVHRHYKDVMKSLIDRHGMHIGDPRCLATFSGTRPRPIKKQLKYLPPSKHNNRLFAEAIALQANISGSDYGILPPGFGNLIFDDEDYNPFNGLTIRAIASRLDSAMSGYNDTTGVCEILPFFDMFYNTIRKIDSSFSGIIDTNQFAAGLIYSPVRSLSDVPFLHLDSSFIQMGTYFLKSIPAAVPERLALFQNYPNPFNPNTTIEFYLPDYSLVTLKIYNTLGQEVAALLDRQEMEYGQQEIGLSATAANLSSGVYYYRLVAETIADEGLSGQKSTITKKMLLLK